MACPLHLAVIPRLMSWDNSAEGCRALSTPTCTVRLSAILNAEEQNVLKTMVRGFGHNEHFWLSGRRLASENEYSWHSTVNQAVTYAGWAPGEPTMVPSELCIVTNRYGEWHDTICASECYVLCESRTCGCTGFDTSVAYDLTASPTSAVRDSTRSPTFGVGDGSGSDAGTAGSSSDGSLNTGGIVGIVLAALVFSVCALLLLRSVRRKKSTGPVVTPPSKVTAEENVRIPLEPPELGKSGRIPEAEVVQVPFAAYESIPVANEMNVPEARAFNLT